MYNDRTIGTCGRCGGPVTVPIIWYAVVPPTPTCQTCGAVPRAAYGPVVDMGSPARPVPPRDGGGAAPVQYRVG